MNEIVKNWKMRTLLISCLTIITCLIFYLLDMTEWANDMRQNGFGGSEGAENRPQRPQGEEPSEIFRFLGSFFKEFLLIGVPMAIAITIGAIYKYFVKKSKKVAE